VCGGGSERQEIVGGEREPQAIYHVPGLSDFIVKLVLIWIPHVSAAGHGASGASPDHQ